MSKDGCTECSPGALGRMVLYSSPAVVADEVAFWIGSDADALVRAGSWFGELAAGLLAAGAAEAS